MSKKFQLTIPEPCHEDWNKMQPEEKGRFCGSCKKAVTDFTGMSDQQLIAFFKKPSTGSVCGRFNHDQLNHDFEIPRKRIPWLKYFFTIAVPAFLASNKANAQGQVRRTIAGDTVLLPQVVETLGKVVPHNICMLPVIKKSITGKVVDEKGNGISFASLRIDSISAKFTADADGNFSFEIPAGKDELNLRVSSLAFISKEVVLKRDNFSDSLIVQLNSKCVQPKEVYLEGTVGMVIAGGVSVRREHKFWSFFKRTKISVGENQIEEEANKKTIFNPIFQDSAFKNFKFYPNPATPGSTITIVPIAIGRKKEEAGEFEIQLLNQDGQIINRKTENFVENTNTVQYNIPFVAAGNYFLVMTYRKSQKRITEKIIIQ